MEPEAVINSFLQLLNNQPELFTGEAKQDLGQLEISVDRVEQLPEADHAEFLADAIIDFCDVNPSVDQALREKLNQQQPEESSEITLEEKRLLLSKIIQSLMTES
ncbi:MAG: hypothetical protein SWJ54_16250 [Cyanobacteriota bacterium]|nr:hypothetical protein [Cyanobacteriota bacterium]